MEKQESVIKINNSSKIIELLGVFDENLDAIMKETQTIVFINENSIVISGDKPNVILAESVIKKLLDIIEMGEKIDKSRIVYCIELARNGDLEGIEKVVSGVVAVTSKGKQIKCKTIGQKKYVDAINKNTIVNYSIIVNGIFFRLIRQRR